MTNNHSHPLVSVLCRSMNRPELVDALASINCQTYDNIEVVLIDASGDGLEQHKRVVMRFPVREVSEGRPLNRPAAANLALQHASGDYLIFLDEDDWFDAEHIHLLVETLENNPDTGVAYSSTQKTTPSGAPTNDTFRSAFDQARLRRDNFIPIHSALFRHSLLTDGACFDQTLDIFEDWDFWLQLATQTRFIHVDRMTAFYREGGHSNTAADDPMMRYQAGHPMAAAREKVFDKWLPALSGRDLNDVLRSLDQTPLIHALNKDIHQLHVMLNGANQETARLSDEIRTLKQTVQLSTLTNKKLNQTVSRKNAELQEYRAQTEHLTQYIHMLQGSLSWRLTRPLRWLRRKFEGQQPAPPHAERHTHGAQLPADTPANSPIKCNLDTPGATQNEFPEQLTVQGWSCSVNGMDRIEARVDEQLISTFTCGVRRPDIAELYPDITGAATSGFHQELDLPAMSAGEHILELRLIDRAGEQSSITRPFFLLKKNDLYNTWYWRNTPDETELAELRAQAGVDRADPGPEFHLLITGASDETLLLATLVSLAEQVWPRWTLHIPHAPVAGIDNFARKNFSAGNVIRWHDSLPSALSVLEQDTGWTGILQAGETLAPHALAEFAQLTAAQNLQLIYSDHDESGASGEHLEPVFTPQWSPEHLLSSNYVGGFYVFRGTQLNNWRALDLQNIAWRYALLLMLAESVSDSRAAVHRIAKVLWSQPAGSVTPAQLDAETSVLRTHISRTHADARVLEQEYGLRAVLWPLTRTPKVSIIIPTMGKPELIKPCIDSLLTKTVYADYEVIMLDNSRGKFPDGIQYLKDRQLRVIECDIAFNWARLNNIGVKHASGELLLFLNDDIEITTSDWLEQLVRQCLRPQTGAVGALLYYPNGALQHTGVLLVNYGGGGIHLLHKRMPDTKIYRQLHNTVREVSANTGACLMVSRTKFEEIGGFDEELAVVGNDVDFCLRLLDRGYRNIWTPLCQLIHHESISRKTTVPKADEKAMWQRWRNRFIAGDDYYNPNLSAERGDFSLQVNAMRVPTALAGAVTADSRQLRAGVNLIGYTRAEMGIGEGARSDARALNAANEPFGIICFTAGNPSRMTDLSWQHKEMDSAPYDVTLLHINPDHALQAIAELPSAYFDGHYTIGYWAWELPEIPQDWEKAFTLFDEIWVPSNFVQDAVAMKSPVPVIRIPHAIEVKTDRLSDRAGFGLPQEPFLFLMMYDVYSTHARKNPDGAIESFCKAFAADDMSVRLVIKINNATADTLEALQAKTGSHQNILLLDKTYSRDEVNAIIASCDCYVSLHRSEGFGFGPAEAMAAGKAVIATNWSGNIDYMRPDNAIGINYQLVVIEQDQGPYKKGQIWAEPDLEQAAQAMKQIAADRELAARIGQKASETIAREFSPAAVGAMMRKRLAAIRSIREQQNRPADT